MADMGKGVKKGGELEGKHNAKTGRGKREKALLRNMNVRL